MSGFLESTQYYVLRSYLKYLSFQNFQNAFEDKLKRTRRTRSRTKFEKRKPELENHLRIFLDHLDRNETVPEQILRSIQVIGSLCKTYCTRDSVMMQNLRTGRAFSQIAGLQNDSSVVWENGDYEKMHTTAHDLSMSKMTKRLIR